MSEQKLKRNPIYQKKCKFFNSIKTWSYVISVHVYVLQYDYGGESAYYLHENAYDMTF
jgi:hypothetical protein